MANTRLAHFDIISKVCTVEIGGIDNGVRYEDIKEIFEDNKGFSATSKIAKRIKATLDIMGDAFTEKDPALRNRSMIQSFITFVSRLGQSHDLSKKSKDLGAFFTRFVDEFAKQIELGQSATDLDYLKFQKTINANIKTGIKTRQEILMRKAMFFDSEFIPMFSEEDIKSSGISSVVKQRGESILHHINRINTEYASTNGDDLFKSTNKTSQALLAIGKPITSLTGYTKFIDHLYFIFRESIGTRLGDSIPDSFVDVNTLRTDLQHDVDHGEASKVRAKHKKAGSVFTKYSGQGSPESTDKGSFPVIQASILTALEFDLAQMSFLKRG